MDNNRYEGKYAAPKPENTPRYRSEQFKKRKRRRKPNIRLIAVLSVILIAAVVVVILLLPKGVNKELVGTWQYDQYTKYEFSSDGTGYLHIDDVSYAYKFKTDGNKLELDFIEDIVTDCEYTFTIDDKKLTFVGGEGTDGGTYSLNKAS